MIELTAGGNLPLVLADGERRTFLEDGDRIVLRGWAGPPGPGRIGLGEVDGTIVAG